MSLPTFSDAKDTVQDAVQNHGRNLIPWLPDPPSCEGCGAMRYATVTYDPTQAMYVNSWKCRHCDAPDTYRDDPVPYPEPPTSGATKLRELLTE